MVSWAAVEAARTDPGWGKFLAMVLVLGGTFVIMSVRDRLKRVAAGAEIDPFSSDAPADEESVPALVDTPTDEPEEVPEKGFSRWLRRG